MAFFVLTLPLFGETTFGYISYSTFNIGDDIQAIAAKRFLPPNSIGIDREFVAPFTHDAPVKTLVNGWFMHTKEFMWYRKDVKPPHKSWPPAPCIEPFFISIYFAPQFLPEVLSEEGIAYLKRYEPIGTRDLATLEVLENAGVEAYFSGCLTLTLDNPYRERKDIIYAVDLSKEAIEYLRAHTKGRVEEVHHVSTAPPLFTKERRLLYAESFFRKIC